MLLLALAALAGWYLAGSWGPSERRYPVQGIDVSHHQGQIDWAALKGSEVDFAYIKATEGGDFRDPRFAENWRGAGSAGIARGAYHFFTLCRPGAEQAANFIRTVPADATALPAAVDLEFGGNCAARPNRPALLRELGAFLDAVEAHSGKPAIFYLTQEFEEAYRVSEAYDRELWLRRLLFEPDFAERPWRIWQASNFRRIRGIEGRVDWNAMR